MTKEQKKNLTWKLKEQPSGHVVAELVAAGVIKPEEGREILFGNSENDKDKVEALEKLVEFLQGLVSDLSKNRGSTTYIPYEKTVYIDRSARPYWDRYWGKTYDILCANNVDVSTSKLTGTAIGGGIATYKAGLPLTVGGVVHANYPDSNLKPELTSKTEGIMLSVNMNSNDLIN